ncbi:MAG: ParB N-terminal domain-containing protein, partial [Pseudomonadota bacterium]
MAKRKRLGPPISSYSPDLEPHEPRMKAPISDVAGDAAANAALRELSDVMEAARSEGRMILNLPLEAVEAEYLLRDRRSIDDGEMAALEASLQARGQQTPIEVAPLGEGRYGLISGWRRLQALRNIGASAVLAIERKAGDAPD